MVIAIIATLIAVLLPALGAARRTARLVKCESNMRQHGVGMSNYAGDARGAMPTFTWEMGRAYSRFPELNNATSPARAMVNQGIDLLRRHSRSSFFTFDPSRQRLLARNFAHLVMFDGGYYSSQLTEPAAVCPDDRMAIEWQRAGPDRVLAVLSEQGYVPPDFDEPAAYQKMFPFWSSYERVACSWSADRGPNALNQNFDKYQYFNLFMGTTRLNQRRIDEVAFPSAKVLMLDLFDRHLSKRAILYAYPVARQPLLHADISVVVRATRDSNPGWDPTLPNTPNWATQFRYAPARNEPPTLSGSTSDTVKGYYRWTREGLLGVDFGGGEVNRSVR